jgi:hypothetical protein
LASFAIFDDHRELSRSFRGYENSLAMQQPKRANIERANIEAACAITLCRLRMIYC